MRRLLTIVSLSILLSACAGEYDGPIEWESPSGNIHLQFSLDEKGSPFYLAFYDQKMVVDTSFLGFDLKGINDLKEGFEILEIEKSAFEETWEQPWGEEQFIHNHYQELTVSLQEQLGEKRKLNIVFRLFDDGIGFRYEFPEQGTAQHLEIEEELTQFHLTGDHDAWWIPAFEPNRYEYLYQKTPLSEMGKVHTPVTFKTQDGMYLSIHEAALKDYSSMVIDAGQGKRLHCELVPYSQEETSKAFIQTPGHTPWRTLSLAKNAGDLVTSYLTLNLNEPNKLGDVSWFKPGKYIGIWWEMHINQGTWHSGGRHSATTSNTKKYIDFAAQHGFQGVLVEGWNLGWDSDWASNGSSFDFTTTHPDFDLAELSQYAQSKGVYLIGHHETGGNINNYEQQMTQAFQQMEDHGIKAVKTGYVEHGNLLSDGKYHHGQAYIDHFYKVIKLAAKHKIAVVAHEPIKDTGERRTFPNIISREGARGQEFNAFGANGGNPPNHLTILPFTRNLAGPMDFTPGVFDLSIPSRPNNQVNTTLAKQLALYVIIYAPMQMACDLPENYTRYPDAFTFIKEVGVDWETTRVLDGEIGSHVVMARKEKGTGNWFLGAITNEEGRDISFQLDFLEPGKTYKAKLYTDAPDAHFQANPEAYSVEEFTLTADDNIEAKLAPGGGMALSLFLQDNPLTMNNKR